MAAAQALEGEELKLEKNVGNRKKGGLANHAKNCRLYSNKMESLEAGGFGCILETGLGSTMLEKGRSVDSLLSQFRQAFIAWTSGKEETKRSDKIWEK